LLNQQNINYTPINFIKEIINQNIQMANQISINNNIINLTISNPLFFQNNININLMNNQNLNPNLIPRQEKVDYFPGKNKKRINVNFINPNGTKSNISAPVNVKVKDLLLVYAKKMKMNPDKFYFLNKGLRLNINEEKDLISFDLDKSNTIVVLDRYNILGGNSNLNL